MNWIAFVQTPNNNVKFVTNEDNSYQVLNYYKFKDYISQYKINNLFEFNRNLDSFETVLLNCVTDEWSVEKPEIKVASFETMLKLNPNQKEVEEENKKKDPLLRKKNFLDMFSKERKRQAMEKKK
jgi:hypothetical protein